MSQIQLDKPRTLKFDLPTLLELEQRMGGKPLAEIVEQLTKVGINAIVMSLWAGLRHEEPELTPTKVAQILEGYINSGKNVIPIARALNEAISESTIFRNMNVEEIGEAPRRRRRG